MLATAVLLWLVVKTGNPTKEEEYNFSTFMKHVDNGDVAEVTIAGANEVRGKLKKGTAFKTIAPPNYPDMIKLLRDKDVSIIIREQSSGWGLSLLINASPFLLLIFFWIFMMRQMQTGGNKALSFGKSRARLLSSQQKKVTFKDVAGVEEAKEELQEIIEFLREPQKFQKLGGRIPKGVLLVGPPGTGKTLLARAIAGEANVPFFSISGSDFVEMFVGVGASRVRDLFEQGKKNAPCIVFIDEIDAVGRHRGAGLGGGHDEREQTLNQLLVEMDGFESNEGVILIAATNRPDVLDPALLRPGRFDRRVVVSRPDVRGREAILRVHTRKIPLHEDVELNVVARGTPGFAGADLANLVNEAALLATRRGAASVALDDFTRAIERIVAGLEKKNRLLNPLERKVVAYHEMGHALVAMSLPGADPVHKISIIPRGIGALGYTIQRPIEDRYLMTRDELENKMAVLLGGRAAEKLVFNHLSTGAADDLAKVTDIARSMVMRYGMEEKLGHVAYEAERPLFLGIPEGMQRGRDYSEETAREIDCAVRKFVESAFDKAAGVLKQRQVLLERGAQLLLQQETLSEEDLKAFRDAPPGAADADKVAKSA